MDQVSSQGNDSIIVINPGATDSRSQNLLSLANVTINSGDAVTWLNKDSTLYSIVSGSPEQGPSNIFYGDYFGPGESYNVTLQNPGNYAFYDPAWSPLKGQIVVTSINNTIIRD